MGARRCGPWRDSDRVRHGAYDPIVEGLGFAALIDAVAFALYLIYRAELCP
jgi:hypothetical protein